MTSAHDPPARSDTVELLDDDGRTRWRIDAGFLTSRWRCLWGDGCQGIHDTPQPELADGCCSVGVRLADEAEAMTISALGASLDPGTFARSGRTPLVERRGAHWHTTVVDGACVFFNPVGFDGGTGCALHLAALADGDDPLDWKPQTCSRMPIRVDEQDTGDGVVVTVRAWRRDDWGPGGATMAWWCTDAAEAYTADVPVLESMAGELRVLFGDALYDRVVRELDR
jgi:hypothetical protein